MQKFKNFDYWLSACENFDMTIFPHMNHMVKERQQKNIIETTFMMLKSVF